MSKQTDAVDAVREFLWRAGLGCNDTLTVKHIHNGDVSIDARYLWELLQTGVEATESDNARQDHN